MTSFIKSTLLLATVLLLTLNAWFAPATSLADDRPNFVVIIGDDISWNDYGTYGHPHIQTPHVDQLAKSGIRFDLAFLTTSSCSPSRCSIMTGRYPHSTGAGELHQPLPADQIIFPQLLKAAGYYTAASGKWHLGAAPRQHFDAITDGKPSGCEQWVSTLKNRTPNKPFFMWFASYDAHRSWSPNAIEKQHKPSDIVVPPYLPDTDLTRSDLGQYYDEVSRMDEYVGKVVAELKRQGELDNTFVLVMADNGRPFPRCKTTLYDSGIRTPFIVHWPSKIKTGFVNKDLVSSVDIAPTILELAGINNSTNHKDTFQGKSFVPLLSSTGQSTREYVFAEHNWHDYAAHDRSVRDKRYLYIRNSFPEFPATPPADAVRSLTYNAMQQLESEGKLTPQQRQCFVVPRTAEELYDLEQDPYSLNNIIADPTSVAVKSRLSGELDKWIARTADKIPTPLTPDRFHRRLGTRLTTAIILHDKSALPPLAPIARKIPPAGIQVDTNVIAKFKSRLAALNIAMQLPQIPRTVIHDARSNVASKSVNLSADIQTLIESVELAVEFNEFYSAGQIAVAEVVLSEAERRVELLASGKQDWHQAHGLVVRGYYSSIDGSAQPYGLEIPADRNLTKSVPLYVWLHGRGDKTTNMHFIHQRMTRAGRIAPSNAIVLHPFGRHCMGFKSAGEIDVLECIEHVKQHYNIDAQRIVLMGFSMGGAGAWHVGAHYADQWVAVSPGAGFAETKEYIKLKPENYPAPYVQTLWGTYDVPLYVRNLFNVPVVAYSGEIDKQIQAAQVMERAFIAEGQTLTHVIGPKMGHRYAPESLADIMKRMEQAASTGQLNVPLEVHLQTRTLRYNRMYWVQALQLTQHWLDSRIDGKIRDNGVVDIQTTNITCFQIENKIFGPPGPLRTVIVDGNSISLPDEQSGATVIFTRVEKTWKLGDHRTAGISKGPQLQGPIDDAFLDPFLVVLPSGVSKSPAVERWIKFEAQHFLDRWRSLYRGTPRVKLDKFVTKEDQQNYNLILWGDFQTNSLIKQLLSNSFAKAGVIQWDTKQLHINNKDYDAQTHVPILIAPNPTAPRKYIVINSGPTHREGHDRTNSLQNPKLPDWAVIDITTAPNDVVPGKIVDAGFFDEYWKYK